MRKPTLQLAFSINVLCTNPSRVMFVIHHHMLLVNAFSFKPLNILLEVIYVFPRNLLEHCIIRVRYAYLAARYDRIRTDTNSTFTVRVEMSQTEAIAVVRKRFTARRYGTSWMPER